VPDFFEDEKIIQVKSIKRRTFLETINKYLLI